MNWKTNNWLSGLMKYRKKTRHDIAEALGYKTAKSADTYISDPKKLNHHQKITLARCLKISSKELDSLLNNKLTIQKLISNYENF